jgi:hypothetical protein
VTISLDHYTELVAIVAALAAVTPTDSCTTYDDGTRWCHFCDAEAAEAEDLTHTDDCLWLRARAHIPDPGSPHA